MHTSCARSPESYTIRSETVLDERPGSSRPGQTAGMNPAARFILLLLVGGTLAFLFFYKLGDRDLWSSHEARAGQNAQTILRTGDWGLPALFDGRPDLQKPPLYYWLVAYIAHLRGSDVDAWAVRLPAALAALAGVLGVGGFLTLRGRPLAGLIAGLTLATALHWTWLARVGRIDMPLSLTVGVALMGFYLAARRAGGVSPLRDVEATDRSLALRGLTPPARLCLLVAYLAIAAGVMLKGPVGAVLPLAVLVCYAGVTRRWEMLRSLVWGLPLVLAVTLPWFWWVNEQTQGEFFRVFFWHHNLERGLGSADNLKVHPWWYYGPRWFVDFLPWSPLVLLAGWSLYRRGWQSDEEARFGLVWLAVIVLVLSCAGFKRSDYLLPAYPGAALLLGCGAERWYRTSARPQRLAVGFGAVVLACVVGWAVTLHHVLPQHEPQREQATFAAAIRRHAPAPEHVRFFRAEAHSLAFHLGWPLDTFLEWENLDIWAGRPGVHYIVMPPDCAAEWQTHVASGRLVEVLRNTDLAGGSHEAPLVLMRTVKP